MYLTTALLAIVFQTNGPASLSVDTPQDKDGSFKIQLADTLKITVIVDGSAALTVKPPAKITKSPGWRLVKASEPTLTDHGKDSKRWQQDYTFEPLAPKLLSLQVEPFEMSDEKSAARRVDWKPIDVQVQSSIASADVSTLRDPTVIESVPPDPETEVDPWLSVAASVLLLVLGVGLYIWWRRRHRQRPARPAVGLA